TVGLDGPRELIGVVRRRASADALLERPRRAAEFDFALRVDASAARHADEKLVPSARHARRRFFVLLGAVPIVRQDGAAKVVGLRVRAPDVERELVPLAAAEAQAHPHALDGIAALGGRRKARALLFHRAARRLWKEK